MLVTRRPVTESFLIAVVCAAAVVAVGVGAAVQPMYGAAGLAAATGVCFVWARPVYAAYILVGVVPIASGLDRGVPIPGFRLSELLTVGLAGVLLVSLDHRRDARWRALDWAAIAYVAAHVVMGVLGSYNEGRPVVNGDLGTLVGPAQYFVYFRALALVLQTEEMRSRALTFLLGSSVVISVSVIVDKFVPGVRPTLHDLTGYSVFPGDGQSVSRASGLFPHFQVASGYLASIVIASAAAFLNGYRTMPRLALAFVCALAGVALVQTVTLTTLLGAAAGVLVLAAWHTDRRRNLAIALISLAAVGAVFSPVLLARVNEQGAVAVGTLGANRNPLVPQTVAYRWEIWTTQSLPALSDRLYVGAGPTLPNTMTWKSTESMYMTLLFRGGVPLLAVWLILWYTMLRTAWRGRYSPDETQRIAAKALTVLLVFLVVMQNIQPYLTYGGISHVVWLLAAIVVIPFRARSSSPTAL